MALFVERWLQPNAFKDSRSDHRHTIDVNRIHKEPNAARQLKKCEQTLNSKD